MKNQNPQYEWLQITILSFPVVFLYLLHINMSKMGSFPIRSVFMYPLYFITIIGVGVFFYNIRKYLKSYARISISILLATVMLIFIFITFPSNESFDLVDLPSYVSHLRQLKRNTSLQPKDIFNYQENDFIKKFIMEKYKIENIAYQIYIKDSTGKLITEYKIIRYKEGCFSDNPHLKCVVKNGNIQVVDVLPMEWNRDSIEYHFEYIPSEEYLINPLLQEDYKPKLSQTLYDVTNNKCSINIHLKHIIDYYFGFIGIVVFLAGE